jgi:hypothetical protein
VLAGVYFLQKPRNGMSNIFGEQNSAMIRIILDKIVVFALFSPLRGHVRHSALYVYTLLVAHEILRSGC